MLAGDDPSHPAFYLPGQELLAGNTRGFWVVDPCKDDGKSCESGVECCSGYCQEEDSGKLTCGRKTSDCVQEFDHCDTRADCCDDERRVRQPRLHDDQRRLKTTPVERIGTRSGERGVCRRSTRGASVFAMQTLRAPWSCLLVRA